MLKIATWNVNSIKIRLSHLLQWISEQQPDILAIQETKTLNENFPIGEINAAGYQVICSGQKTYNGVAILSKIPAKEVITDIPNLEDPQRRILAATYSDIRVLNLYVPNGESVDSEKYHYKLNWLEKMKAYAQQQLQEHRYVMMLGDFNIAPEDRDVHNPTVWEGHVLVSVKEREALSALMDIGFHDSFRLFHQETGHYSWWDYRQLAFRRNHGLRIDHVLINDALREKCVACTIDKEPRRWERPSDHVPVMAEFQGL